jgi:hypothetical protein
VSLLTDSTVDVVAELSVVVVVVEIGRLRLMVIDAGETVS